MFGTHKEKKSELFMTLTPKNSHNYSCNTCKYSIECGNGNYSCNYTKPVQIYENNRPTNNYYWCNGRYYEYK